MSDERGLGRLLSRERLCMEVVSVCVRVVQAGGLLCEYAGLVALRDCVGETQKG